MTARVAGGALPHFVAGAALRMVVAGTAWGIVLVAGFAGWSLYDCGAICLSDMIATAAIAVPTGIAVIGPLAVLGRSA